MNDDRTPEITKARLGTWTVIVPHGVGADGWGLWRWGGTAHTRWGARRLANKLIA